LPLFSFRGRWLRSRASYRASGAPSDPPPPFLAPYARRRRHKVTPGLHVGPATPTLTHALAHGVLVTSLRKKTIAVGT
jgi:hypothetical protein